MEYFGSPMVLIALFGFVPLAVLLFVALAPRQAVIWGFLLGWLFLPFASVKIAQGIPVFSKVVAVNLGVFLGAMIFDSARLLQVRWRWFDGAMIMWVAVSTFSSLSNGLGLYDGLSSSMTHMLMWGLPWWIGRAYFSDPQGLRELALGMVKGGLIYMPLSWYEVRMSPQLHNAIYGFSQHDWFQMLRFGGYRPILFMQHGLAVGMWFTAATLCALWLRATGSIRQLWGAPMTLWVALLVITTILCKSVNAILLLGMGTAALWIMWRMRWSVAVLGLLLIPPTYILLRAPGLWSGQSLVDAVNLVVNQERGGSLQFRMDNEDRLAEKAMTRPLFGWGGWGRERAVDETGHDISTTDGLWVIALGQNGLVGLVSISLCFLLPAFLLYRRMSPANWGHPAVAPAAALAVLASLHMIDNLANAMINPFFILAAAGVAGAAGAGSRAAGFMAGHRPLAASGQGRPTATARGAA